MIPGISGEGYLSSPYRRAATSECELSSLVLRMARAQPLRLLIYMSVRRCRKAHGILGLSRSSKDRSCIQSKGFPGCSPGLGVH